MYRSFRKIHSIEKGSRPTIIAIDEEENIYYGEYYSNKSRGSVKIYSKKQ
jgi:hypothetical protein